MDPLEIALARALEQAAAVLARASTTPYERTEALGAISSVGTELAERRRLRERLGEQSDAEVVRLDRQRRG